MMAEVARDPTVRATAFTPADYHPFREAPKVNTNPGEPLDEDTLLILQQQIRERKGLA